MTETPEAGDARGGPPERRCGWCRRPLPPPKATGRPRRYCSGACRQWDWVARRGTRDVRLTEEQLVLARAQVDDLHDAIYVLTCAMEDAERDLAALGANATTAEVREALDWVLDNARPLLGLQLRPI